MGKLGDTRKLYPSTVNAFQIQNGAESVRWTNWMEWSSCTKTCGFGISIRTRECVTKDVSRSSDLVNSADEHSRGCLGVYKEIRTCNTQLCPTGIPASRESQCSEFNHKAFMGRQYKWEPFINPKGQCELTCRAKGFRFYARLAATVADGTPCVPGDEDLCIAGLCKKVGCDGIVGSYAVLDACGQCKGDNSSCNIISGTRTSDQLIQGYNTVLRIPTGAASINVTEVRRSSNFLAMKTSGNKYILNGPQGLSSEGEYFAAGTKFTYHKNQEGWCPGQCLHAKGPTSEPIEIQILYYNRNPGIRYQYSVPKISSISAEVNRVHNRGHETSTVPTRDTELQGYLSDSREVQNDQRSHERTRTRAHSSRDTRHHHGQRHTDSARSKQTLYFPKYTQSFTFGGKSVINQRYRPDGVDTRSTDHRIRASSSDLHNSRYIDATRHASSGEVNRTRSAHSNSRPHSYSSSHHNSQYGQGQQIHAQTKYPQPSSQRRTDSYNRQTDSYLPQTDSRFRPTASPYRQTSSPYRHSDSRNQQSNSRHTHVDLLNRQTPSPHRQTDSRYHPTDTRHRQTGSRYNPTDTLHRQTDSRYYLPDRRSHSPQEAAADKKKNQNSHRSLADNNYQIAVDVRRREQLRKHRHNLNIQKQPVFLQRTDSPNRALTFTTLPTNINRLQNRVPSISRIVDNRVERNRTWSEQDIRDFNSILSGQNTVSKGEYSWKISGLTDCTASCGGGYQETIIICVKRSSQAVVTDENCEYTARPETHIVICNEAPCPAGWHVTEWGGCSASCDTGVQRREVMCKRKLSAGVNITVDTKDCSGLVRPISAQRCGEQSCFLWVPGNWTRCSALCGKGERTRDVVCQALSGQTADDKQCSRRGRKPSQREVCDLGSCGIGWFYTQWPEHCSAACGEGKQERKIHCAGPRGNPLEDNKCRQFHKPDKERSCKTDIPCGGKWFTGPWFKCNSTCGVGVQRRDVLCMKKLGLDFVTVVEDENCVMEEKPISVRSCENLPRCRPEWYMKDWGQCSASCGTGYRTREVKCLDDKQVPSPDCRQNDKPVIRESCNVHSCHRTHKPTDGSCKDTFYSCNVVVQARMCVFKYYKTVCCDSCVQSGQISRA
ncbi:thrombospondin type-1 domain-containing protein 4-like isoform X2 [Liolophura sinensis]